MATKTDDFAPFPVKDQLPGVEFCVSSSPNWPEGIVLGFQHYIVMLGTTVIIPSILVPLMGGGDVEKAEVINTVLFVSGINTLLQSLFGSRLPVVMGASYAYVIPALYITFSYRFTYYLHPHLRFEETMRAIQGALIIASIIHMITGFFGLWRILVRFLTPLSAAPLVILTAVGLVALAFPQLARCIEIGLPALIILIILSQYLPHLFKCKRSICEQFAVLFTIAIVWAYAEILTAAGAYDKRPDSTQLSCRTDRSGLISASPWVRIPYPLQWGRPSFHASDAFAMMAATYVAIVETTGSFIAASRFGSATHIPPSVLSRGIGWQGIGVLLGGLFGTATGSTALVENTGLLGLTKVGSRRVVQIAAGFMIFFSIFGKFGAVLASIPLPIFAALYCVLFAYVASAGLGLLQFCNINSFRTKFILGFSIFIGLSVAQYFTEYLFISGRGPVHTRTSAVSVQEKQKPSLSFFLSCPCTDSFWCCQRQFNVIMQVIFSSAATVGVMAAFLLDCTHSYGHASVRRDSGRHWWEKFRVYHTDTRTEEFYALPYNLNRFFPSF
ncbi:nucleobase-ascorbate transporter 4 isoform X1 [Arabidopsis lyrata subsp. lyrata]|uniref:nucleobase-ascorbate transporter 4 isoform X1 n=1 Tax=Arabidopsis lyrata subsp. lyrata TaxID=81972 RepID=UPI000A29A23B|nr:nucleobase-ascorbate transporter 4 isoform X1 [Arabidopsis lyrata subsp. lyrata]|eukprot:XP_020866709.1 nucleobase-ascorbate transporter 4 isoform X1 [Arabidopsis lyrata subsp. lyrata]